MAKNSNPNNKTMVIGAIVLVLLAVGVVSATNRNNSDSGSSQESSQVEDYVGKDAKEAYEALKDAGYNVKFVFDRNNNGGFTEDSFQSYVTDSFSEDDYVNNPFTVTKQSFKDKEVTLSLEYTATLESEKAQEERNAKLEEKLGIVESMTACQQYGESNYRDFKMHSILGKITEYASDDDTWFLKYRVDANGYNDLTMECYVTGTTSSPVVKSFTIY